MVPVPEDLPRRMFPDAASFLTVARALLDIGAWHWRTEHMLAHSVTEMEAVNFLRLATVRMVRPDRQWVGRWRVDGYGFDGRRLGLSVSVQIHPEGERVFFVSAFRPDDP